MTKLEKVIKGLGLCRWRYEDYGGYWPAYDYDKPEGCSHAYVCWKCPYRAKENEDIDYSDCIEELHEDALELLKAQEAQDWISVKDSAPTIQDGRHGIIICDANRNVHSTRGLIHMNTGDGVILYFDDSHSDCYWTIVRGKKPKYNTLIKGNEITHWMPLPEPPKEEADEVHSGV